jgi:hypothetical protein
MWSPQGLGLGPLGAFLLSSVLGLSIVVSQALSTTVNSPLATSVTGNLKDLLTTAVSSFIFRDYHATPLSLFGLDADLAVNILPDFNRGCVTRDGPIPLKHGNI